VERGVLSRLSEYLPTKAGKLFVVTSEDIWKLHGDLLSEGLTGRAIDVLFFPPGEINKRFDRVEALAERMVQSGADRSSAVIAFGGGIVGDTAGFLAAIFMRGIPVLQVPTTLLAQVDAAIGGKTAVNLTSGKNLIGAFHQPRAVLIDPNVLSTLPEREYRAGLFEIVKCGIIASPDLFHVLDTRAAEVLAQDPATLDYIISESVRIKAEVVSADEKEGDLRRILNFGHTFGHALEAETAYSRFLHGEAVAWGMRAACFLAARLGMITNEVQDSILSVIAAYGHIPSLEGISAEALASRLASDKKTLQGKVHFVLPDRIGHVVVRSGINEGQVLASMQDALT
jgi:3-dehydroquinate synthase